MVCSIEAVAGMAVISNCQQLGVYLGVYVFDLEEPSIGNPGFEPDRIHHGFTSVTRENAHRALIVRADFRRSAIFQLTRWAYRRLR